MNWNDFFSLIGVASLFSFIVWVSYPGSTSRLRSLYQGREVDPQSPNVWVPQYRPVNCLVAPEFGARQVGMLVGAAGLMVLGLWLPAIPTLIRSLIVLGSLAPIYFLGVIPFRAERLIQVKDVVYKVLVAFILIGLLVFFTDFESALKWAVTLTWIFVVNAMIDKALLNLPPKNHGIHLRQGRISGWLLENGGQYIALWRDKVQPQSDELEVIAEDAFVEVEVAGLAGVKVPMIIQAFIDKWGWNNQWENVSYLTSPAIVRGGIIDSMTPLLRQIAAAMPDVGALNRAVTPINLLIQYTLETDYLPHQDEALLARLRCGENGCVIQFSEVTIGGALRRVVAEKDLVAFYAKYKVQLEEELPRHLIGRSETERRYGRVFAGAGVAIKDVKTSEGLEEALEAPQRVKLLADATRALADIPTELLDRALAANGQATVARISLDRGGQGQQGAGNTSIADQIAEGITQGAAATAAMNEQNSRRRAPRRGKRGRGNAS